MSNHQPIVIGVAGGSGSGKTTVAEEIIKHLPDDSAVILAQDSYYNDNRNLSMEERKKINYDHPDAYDMPLMLEQLQTILQGKSVEVPIYNFTTLSRTQDTIHTEPADIVVIEGILVLADKRLRDLMDIKVFVDTDDDIRFIRRLERDTKERGRSIDWIIGQYLKTVKPSYNQFIEPSKKYADIIIPQGGENQVAINMVSAQLRAILEQ